MYIKYSVFSSGVFHFDYIIFYIVLVFVSVQSQHKQFSLGLIMCSDPDSDSELSWCIMFYVQQPAWIVCAIHVKGKKSVYHVLASQPRSNEHEATGCDNISFLHWTPSSTIPSAQDLMLQYILSSSAWSSCQYRWQWTRWGSNLSGKGPVLTGCFSLTKPQAAQLSEGRVCERRTNLSVMALII